MTLKPSRTHFAVKDLNPKMAVAVSKMIGLTTALIFDIGGQRACFQPFEGFRNPERQNYLLTVSKTTKAGPWESAHQYGLAVDFACRVINDNGSLGEWCWPVEAPWDELRRLARSVGLDIPISWDKGHVQSPIWDQITLS